MDVLELQGVSGATYRFRRMATSHDLPAQAGNFVAAASGPPGSQVLACGTRRSLSELRRLWADLTSEDAQVYVRLNVTRSVRLTEHDDLVAALAPRDVLPEAY